MSNAPKLTKSWLLLIALLTLSVPTQATLIDFSSLSPGSYASIGDTSFSLVGDGVKGAPIVSQAFPYLLNLSQDFSMNVNSVLRVDFGSLVDNLNFSFNGFGEGSFFNWRIFDNDLTQIDSQSFTQNGLNTSDLSAYSGISRLELFYTGNTNRIFGLSQISFDTQSVAAVSEPGSVWLIILAIAGVFVSRQRNNSK